MDGEGDRTENSQTSCHVYITDPDQVVYVNFDTTKLSDAALAQDGSAAKEITEDMMDEYGYQFWPVTYNVYKPQTLAGSFGVIGSFAQSGWTTDVPMTDDDGDGIYTAEITGEEPGDYEFKVRADGAWDLSWGDYEWLDGEGDRTQNSMTNCRVTITDTTDVIKVELDTTRLSAAALAQEGSAAHDIKTAEEMDTYGFTFWPVSYWVNGEPANFEAGGTGGSSEKPVQPDYYETVIDDYIYFDNSETQWDKVCMYFWNTDLAPTCDLFARSYGEEFPGIEMKQIPGTDIYQALVPFNATKIIFNSGVSDNELNEAFTAGNPINAYSTTDLDFDSAANAGQVYMIDTSAEPKSAGLGWKKTKLIYSEGAWSGYSGDFISERFEESSGDNPGGEVDDPPYEDVDYPYYPDEDEDITDFYYSENYDGTITITQYNGNGTNVVIPSEIKGKAVTAIDDYAFEYSEITSVIIPDGVKYIGDYAFEGCYSLENITIPDSVIKVGTRAFHDTPWYYNQPEGLLYTGKVAYAYICNDYTYDEQSIVLKEGTTSIADSAFNGCYGLTGITIPDSVTYIGNYAFYQCYNLTDITIPGSVTYIGNYAFCWCDEITNLIISDSVTHIGDYAFYGCDGITNLTIPDGVIYIGESAFGNCDALASVSISRTVKYIGESAFADCRRLAKITVDNNNENYSSQDNVLFNKDKTKLILCPARKSGQYIIPNTVTSICKDAFVNCERLTGITIPDSVTFISKRAFENCTGLTTVKLPDSITQISDSMFYGCDGLTEVTIPDSVKCIDYDAFYDCQGLKKITVPKSVTYIGYGALGYGEGYSEDGDYWSYCPIDGFTIYGEKDSAAETYAYNHDINFVMALANNSTISKTTINKGDSITLTGVAEGGTEPYKYSFLCKHSSATSWTTLTSYGTTSKRVWQPKQLGTYTVRAKVKDATGNEVIKDFKLTVKSTLSNSSTLSKTTINYGDALTITGKATGGTSPYQYSFLCKHSSATKWTTLTSYGTTSKRVWKPTKSGTYSVRTKVKDADGAEVIKDFKLTVNSTALTNNSTLSKTTINFGDALTITGKAANGTAPYQYSFLVKHSTATSWTTLTSYGTTSTRVWTPLKSGTYTVRTKVKDATGKEVVKDFKLTVNAVFANNSTLSKTTINFGNSLTITGKAANGTSPYQYSFLCKHSSATSWTTLTSYGTTSTRVWKPTKSGTYSVRTKVKDATGKEVVKDFTLTVK